MFKIFAKKGAEQKESARGAVCGQPGVGEEEERGERRLLSCK